MIKGVQNAKKQVILKKGEQTIINSEGVANEFAKHYATVNSVERYNEEMLINMLEK